MPTLNSIWQKHATYTRNASEIVRGLCWSGIALIWLLRESQVNGSGLHVVLRVTALFFMAALLVDLSQYLVGAKRVRIVAEDIQEKNPAVNPDVDQFEYPDGHDAPMNRLFKLKVGFVLCGYVLLVSNLVLRVVEGTLP